MDDLEKVIKLRVKPIVDEATERHLGLSIDKLTDDITSKLGKTTLVDIEADTSLPYKEAKKKFKKQYFLFIKENFKESLLIFLCPFLENWREIFYF